MFSLMSLPFWLSNKLWWSVNKLKHGLWWVFGGALFNIIFVYCAYCVNCNIFVHCVYFVYIVYCVFDIDIWYLIFDIMYILYIVYLVFFCDFRAS